MMRIDLHNYEAFLLDWVEGQLSPEAELALRAFLQEHPELEIDLDGIADTRLPDERIFEAIPDFGYLRKQTDSVEAELEALSFAEMELELSASDQHRLQHLLQVHPTWKRHYRAMQHTRLGIDVDIILQQRSLLHRSEAFETWFDRVLVESLDAPPSQALRAFLERNPEWERHYRVIQATRLSAETIPFPAKDSLYRAAAPARVIPLFYRSLAAAAALALLMGLFFLFNSGSDPVQVAQQQPTVPAQSDSVSGLPTEIPNTPSNIEERQNPERQFAQQGKPNKAPQRKRSNTERLPQVPLEALAYTDAARLELPFELETRFLSLSPEMQLNQSMASLYSNLGDAPSELSTAQRVWKGARKLLKRGNVDIEAPLEAIQQQGFDEFSYQQIEKVSRGFIRVQREQQEAGRKVTGFAIGSLSYSRPSR
jgi:anti-sigma factor RsiW